MSASFAVVRKGAKVSVTLCCAGKLFALQFISKMPQKTNISEQSLLNENKANRDASLEVTSPDPSAVKSTVLVFFSSLVQLKNSLSFNLS